MEPLITRGSRHSALVAVAMVTTLSACAPTGQPKVPRAEVADVLRLPDGARIDESRVKPALLKNGRSIYEDGTGVVSFGVEANCEAIADAIVGHFASSGWRERRTQKRNPANATSFEHGCQERPGGGVIILGADGRPVPRRGPLMAWHGEWENERGDILIYMISSVGTDGGGRAEYVPRDAW
jgi:hypothetical protein